MPTPPTATQLDNARVDAENLDTAVNSTQPTYTTRRGVQRLTLYEATRRMGFESPVAYTAGLLMQRPTQTVTNSGQRYYPDPAQIPFTTSGTFETSKFLVHPLMPDQLALPGAADGIGHEYSEATGPSYLKTLSDIANGDEVSINRFLTQTQINDVTAAGNTEPVNARIQVALTAGVKDLRLERGSYLCTAGFTVPVSVGSAPVRIRGAGKGATTLKASGTFSKVITLGNSTDQTIRGELRDFGITAIGANVEYGIYGDRTEEHDFVNLWCRGFTGAGIATGYGYVNNFVRVECSYNGGHGLKLHYDTPSTPGANNAVNVENCLLFSNGRFGLWARGGNGVWVRGGTIEVNGWGGIMLVGMKGVYIQSYFELNGQSGHAFTTPVQAMKADIILSGGTDYEMSSAFPCENVVVESSPTIGYVGKTTFLFNAGADGVTLRGINNANGLTPVLYQERYDAQYKGSGVVIDDCPSFATPIQILSPVSATNNVSSALFDVRGQGGVSMARQAVSDGQAKVNLAEQDFNRWSLVSSGSTATTYQRQVSNLYPHKGRPVWEILTVGSGSSDIFGFTVAAADYPELIGKPVYWGMWLVNPSSDPYLVLYCNQQSANANPTASTGVWRFNAVSFIWPASGNVICGAYASGTANGRLYFSYPLLCPVGYQLEEAMSTVEAKKIFFGTAQPTTGYWFAGDVVINVAPAVGEASQWSRITTGSGHVAGTDWAATPNLV